MFAQVYDTLQPLLAKIPPFDITFKKMDHFGHGTVFLVPETQGNQLQEIHKIIINAFPELKENREFHPHMTVGKFAKGVVAARAG